MKLSPNRRLLYAWYLSGLLCLFSIPSAQAALRTFLEPRLIDEMDTVRLTIRAEGSNQSEAPDLSALEDDFEVLGNQTSSRISSINGRTLASVEYQISLRPRRTGELTVPRLKIGDEYSEAIQLIVRPLDPQLKQTIENMVFFETDVSRNPVYVQAETILTRRLFYSQGVQIYSDLPGVPEVGNAVVIPLGETQSRSTIRGAQRYGVIEQRFALFPEQSGKLIIPAISVTSSVRLQSGGRTRRSGIRVSTDAIELEVLPIPAEYPARAPWLPATAVTLEQDWHPEKRDIEVGDPLSFSVRVEAIGNRGSAIPPVPLPLPAQQFKIYPEAPVMDESAHSGTINGSRAETYALIPISPGNVSLPALSITWWDTNADELRQSLADVAPLNITGASTGQVAEQQEPTNETSQAAPVAPPAAEPVNRDRALTMVIGTVLAGLGIAGLAGLSRHFHISLAGMTFFRFPQQSEQRRTAKALSKAAAQTDPGRFRQALVDYLSCIYDSSPADALDEFRCNPESARELRLLDQALYSSYPASDPASDPAADSRPGEAASRASDFALLAGLARAAAERHAQVKHQDPLPALYS